MILCKVGRSFFCFFVFANLCLFGAAIPVHFSCGAWSVIAAALFADRDAMITVFGPALGSAHWGLFLGGGGWLLLTSIIAIVVVGAWSVATTGLLFWLMRVVDSWRQYDYFFIRSPFGEETGFGQKLSAVDSGHLGVGSVTAQQINQPMGANAPLVGPHMFSATPPAEILTRRDDDDLHVPLHARLFSRPSEWLKSRIRGPSGNNSPRNTSSRTSSRRESPRSPRHHRGSAASSAIPLPYPLSPRGASQPAVVEPDPLFDGFDESSSVELDAVMSSMPPSLDFAGSTAPVLPATARLARVATHVERLEQQAAEMEAALAAHESTGGGDRETDT